MDCFLASFSGKKNSNLECPAYTHMLKKHPVYLCSYIHVVMYTVCTVLTGLYLRQGCRNQDCRGGGHAPSPHHRVLLKQWLILLAQDYLPLLLAPTDFKIFLRPCQASCKCCVRDFALRLPVNGLLD